jgi:adenosylhomocysteine nucleosidase
MPYFQRRLGFVILLLAVTFFSCQCTPVQHPATQPIETTPRLAIVSAFEPELKQLLSQAKIEQRYEINGRSYYSGQLAGHQVILFLSGVSMVNAAMSTQAAIDHFNLTGIILSGIAGGINPDLNIGDVVIPKQWAEYQEQVFARQTSAGWDTGWHKAELGNFGMMFPQSVSVTRSNGRLDAEENKFWFSVDPAMLAAAERIGSQLVLKSCPKIGSCLKEAPKIKSGGNGASGSTFVDNADYRKWVWQNFQADSVDMETAAAAHVAYVNNIPFLAFRSLSDLAGGGPGENEMTAFLQLAADNSSTALLTFLKELEP